MQSPSGDRLLLALISVVDFLPLTYCIFPLNMMFKNLCLEYTSEWLSFYFIMSHTSYHISYPFPTHKMQSFVMHLSLFHICLYLLLNLSFFFQLKHFFDEKKKNSCKFSITSLSGHVGNLVLPSKYPSLQSSSKY